MRQPLRSDLASVAAGFVAGIIVLGIGGRLAMAALPTLTGTRPVFSWGGSVEVVLLGAMYGAVGGVILALLIRLGRPVGATRGLLLGVLLLGAAWASSSVGRSTARSAPVALPAVVLIGGVVFLGYGILADKLERRWRRESDAGRVRAA